MSIYLVDQMEPPIFHFPIPMRYFDKVLGSEECFALYDGDIDVRYWTSLHDNDPISLSLILEVKEST